MLGNLCGQPEVWVAFSFESDSSVTYEGTYVDDVVLRAFVEATMPTPTPTQTPPSGLLFFDDFSDPNSGWPESSSESADRFYENGEYHIRVKQQNLVAWGYRTQVFSDFDVRFRARALESSSTNTGSEGQAWSEPLSDQESLNLPQSTLNPDIDGAYGLLFRYVDAGNFYYFTVSPFAGQYRLNKQVNDEWVTIQLWTTSPYINLGSATNELRVVAQGATISLYVNGHHLFSATDTSFSQGWFALAASNFDEPAGMHAAFDDFAVYSVGAGGDIYGQVTYNGVSAPDGIGLELRFHDGSSWSTAATTTTTGGDYHFRNMPSLGPGQVYYVRYRNIAGTSGYLWGWWCTEITSYSAGSSVRGGDFDIADVPLGLPDSADPQPLPLTFNWTIRGAAPSDTYEFHMWDPDSGAEYFSSDLGHVNSYTLDNLPDGFTVGKPYSWDVYVYGPYGVGLSYQTHTVKFSAAYQVYLPLLLKYLATPPPPVPLCNGDFETGAFEPYWAFDGELTTSVASTLSNGDPPHGGGYAALLGEPSEESGTELPVGRGWIEQEFTVPSTGSPGLSFRCRGHKRQRGVPGWLLRRVDDTVLKRLGMETKEH